MPASEEGGFIHIQVKRPHIIAIVARLITHTCTAVIDVCLTRRRLLLLAIPRLLHDSTVLLCLIFVIFVEALEETTVSCGIFAPPNTLFFHTVDGIGDVEGFLEGSKAR